MKKIVFLFFAALLYFSASAQSDSTLQAYVGKYKFADGSVISEASITIESGGLSITSSAGTSPMEKKGDDLFTITTFSGTAKFKRDASKKVTGISISAMGYELEGTKVDGINIGSLLLFLDKNAKARVSALLQ